MQYFITRPLIGVIFLLLSYGAMAELWFTGPLITPGGHTVPMGHTNLEIYATNTINLNNFTRTHPPQPKDYSQVINPSFSHGLTENIDLQVALPYISNKNQGTHADGIGDASLVLGYQLLEQRGERWRPDLRVALVQILPAGRYDTLNILSNGADGMGLGSYQVGLQLNFQHLLTLPQDHYLRSRLSLAYYYSNPVTISGVSVFNGSVADTFGTIKPGDYFGASLATELTLTQNWVAVMEVQAFNITGTNFKGFAGTNSDGSIPRIGHGVFSQVTLAPAIEYNFSPNIGLVVGPAIGIAGHELRQYVSYILALNMYW